MHRRMLGLLPLSFSELEQGIGYSSPKAKRPLLEGHGYFFPVVSQLKILEYQQHLTALQNKAATLPCAIHVIRDTEYVW